MSQLPPELTRVPPSSLDVLRYMGKASLDAADSDQLSDGTGMSQRAVGRAIRGLVTKGYLNMDDGYVYHLTEKGLKAVEDVRVFDAANPSGQSGSDDGDAVEQNLVAVLPSPLGSTETSTLQLGLDRLPQIADDYQLILRFSTTSGSINPSEVTLDLQPNQEVSVGETYFTPTKGATAVRIRVEATQVGMMDAYSVGGMYFDVPIDQASGGLQAWYGNLKLQS